MNIKYWCLVFLLLLTGLMVVSTLGGCAFKMGAEVSPAPPPSVLASATLKVPPDNGPRSVLIIPYDTDKLILESESILLGKVAEIMPSREETQAPGESLKYNVYTDIVVQPQRYFWGGPGDRVTIRVQGGKIGNLVMWAEDVPLFVKGETALFFLSLPPAMSGTPEIVNPAYYLVTGGMQGKYEYQNGAFISLSGQTLSPLELEQKIARLRKK